MGVRDNVVKAGEKLAREIGANAIIVISPKGQEIRRMLDTGYRLSSPGWRGKRQASPAPYRQATTIASRCS